MREATEVRESRPEYGGAEEAVPPGYKRTKVGVIPEDWDLIPMHMLYSFRNGVNADKTAYGFGVPFVNVLEIVENSHLDVPQVPGKVTLSERIRAEFDLRHGDLVFNRTSETQDEVGLSAAYVGTESIAFGGFVIRARPDTTLLDSTFAGYSLRETTVHSQVVRGGQGAIRANIGQSDLKSVLVPVPPLPEQRAIARALSDVDDLISALDKLIEKKRAIKQATMQQLLTGRTRLPGFGGEWMPARIGDISSLYAGLSGKSANDFGHGSSLYVPFLNVITNEVVDPQVLCFVNVAQHESQNGIAEGDILLNGTSETPEELAMAALVPALRERVYLNSFCFGLRVHNQESYAPLFLVYLLRSAVGRAVIAPLAQGATRYNLSKERLLDVSVILPPGEEQRAIAAVLSDMDAEIEALERRREKTRLVKQGMMQELLTGRIRLVEPSNREARAE